MKWIIVLTLAIAIPVFAIAAVPAPKHTTVNEGQPAYSIDFPFDQMP